MFSFTSSAFEIDFLIVKFILTCFIDISNKINFDFIIDSNLELKYVALDFKCRYL